MEVVSVVCLLLVGVFVMVNVDERRHKYENEEGS